jgi:DNA polymerase-4/DNA polymerase V
MSERKPFLKYEYPRAFFHLDGDAFFASVEVAKNPALKGKPVVTGEERGIATAISYEAKKFGIPRAMPIHEIRKKFPEVIVVHSDYESYALYSRRMMDIVRRLTDRVEEASIDECYAELTGLRRPLHLTYHAMAARIQKEIDDELGVSVSIGIAPTKTLAKLASKWGKPHGITCIPGTSIHDFLKDTPAGKVCGIGHQTSAYLESLGIRTALEFADRDEGWVMHTLSKPYQELWHELRGESVFLLRAGDPAPQKSIQKTETFTPPSRDRARVYAELSQNIERACKKAREHGLHARTIHFFLKTQEFRFHTAEFSLGRPTNDPIFILELLQKAFLSIYRKNVFYRATGVTLGGLESDTILQEDLFGTTQREEDHKTVFRTVDQIECDMGKGTVFLASSFASVLRHKAERKKREPLKELLAPQKFFGIPVLGEVG